MMANAPHTSAYDDTIVDMVKHAISSGRKATFYLTSAQSNAVRAWFLTPEPRCSCRQVAAS
jgi:hypothetical protein